MPKFTIEQLQADIAEMIPNAVMEYDNHGQIVIYTGMVADEEGVLWKFEGPDLEESEELETDPQGPASKASAGRVV